MVHIKVFIVFDFRRVYSSRKLLVFKLISFFETRALKIIIILPNVRCSYTLHEIHTFGSIVFSEHIAPSFSCHRRKYTFVLQYSGLPSLNIHYETSGVTTTKAKRIPKGITTIGGWIMDDRYDEIYYVRNVVWITTGLIMPWSESCILNGFYTIIYRN